MKTEKSYLTPNCCVMQIRAEYSVCTSGQPQASTEDLEEKFNWENDLWQ